jgi:hypothetical protein
MIIIQSYIDLITNSSTSVFQWANNVNGVKKIINAILKSAGSDLTCNDLFNIAIHYDISIDNAIDYYFDLADKVMQENPDKHPVLKQLLEDYDNCFNSAKLVELEKEIYEYLIENCGAETLDEYAKSYNDDSDEDMYSSYYSIEAKNPENEKYANIIHKINNLFGYDACYC